LKSISATLFQCESKTEHTQKFYWTQLVTFG